MLSSKPIIIYPNTVPARFVRRLNRFTAEVLINGNLETVHVKNTGRLRELLLPDAEVTLQKSGNPSRKTAYDLISVYKPGLEWVNIDSLAPNALMKLQLLAMGYDLVRPEYTYGKSRFDFYMERGDKRYLMEVKGCTLAAETDTQTQHRGEIEGQHLLSPVIMTADADHTIVVTDRRLLDSKQAQNPNQKIGLFPDAPTERGVKHLNELAAAAGKGFDCSISFVIQMNGIRRVLPNYETHPAFGEALERAVKAGVGINHYQCHVEADRIEITGVEREYLT